MILLRHNLLLSSQQEVETEHYVRPAEEMITSSQGKEVGVVIKAGSLKEVVFQLHVKCGRIWVGNERGGGHQTGRTVGKMVWEEGTEHSADSGDLISAQLRAPGRDSTHYSSDRAQQGSCS